MLELIQKIKTYTEAGIILEHMELFDEIENINCEKCVNVVWVEIKGDDILCDSTEYHCCSLNTSVPPSFSCGWFIEGGN